MNAAEARAITDKANEARVEKYRSECEEILQEIYKDVEEMALAGGSHVTHKVFPGWEEVVKPRLENEGFTVAIGLSLDFVGVFRVSW